MHQEATKGEMALGTAPKGPQPSFYDLQNLSWGKDSRTRLPRLNR